MFLNGDKETIKYTERRYIPGNSDSENNLKSTTALLTSYINNHLKIIPGAPVFGTNLIDTDVVIYIKVSDTALNARLESRNTKHRPAQRARIYAIRALIEQDVDVAKNKGLIVEVFPIS